VPRNPQAEQMADPSMIVNLDAQAGAIWPQHVRPGRAQTELGPGAARALFDQLIESCLDPAQYVVWHVPIISGRRPCP